MSTTSLRKKHKIYFAYGGNIHLKRMAKRCPNARYLGVARLSGYRWQINERGYANIVKVSMEPRDASVLMPVQGLCYLITAEDEAKLDRAEGVPTAYQKRILAVELVLAKASLVGRDVDEIMSLSSEEVKAGSGRLGQNHGSSEAAQALVYVSKDFTTDGLPRAEYAGRMRLGLRNALDLGISREYGQAIERVLDAGVRVVEGANNSLPAPSPAPSPRPRPNAVSDPMTPPASTPGVPTYYFAFGSNMQLSQMALRCPGSKVFAKGVLPGYRWQINQRGVANIVRTPPQDGTDSVIQGILFTVTPSDVRTLDRYEGVADQLYDKIMLPVQVEPLAVDGLKGVKTTAAAGKLASTPQTRGQSTRQGVQRQIQGPHRQRSKASAAKEVEALVYISSKFKKDGHIRGEYVGRMQLAMADAVKLGVDEAYLGAALHPMVFSADGEVASDQGKREILVREPARGAEQGGVSGSPKGHRIIERVPVGTGNHAAA
ncbi:hypothetical protein BDW66DRAFT_98516 [Aspergillus desertorum]